MVKVLLIEDDPTMLSLLGILLEMEGFQPIQLDHFGAVLMAIKNDQPDVVLMDINLKEANGLEILAEMRQDPSFDEIKVIMSSGMDYSTESLEKGANDFIQKPYMPDDLILKVKTLAGDAE